MKVVCESCHARYQIPDERVAGRALRIRCRKCGGKIVVRGDSIEPSVPSVGAAAGTSADGLEWYISEDGEQQGPLSTDDLLDRLKSGRLSWDTFLWRDGIDDWIPASAAPEFSHAVPAAHVSAPMPSAPPGEDEPTRMFSPALPFAPTPSFRPDRRPPAAPVPQDSFAALSTQLDGGRPLAAGAARATTGSTSEDAVLFSVSNLQNYGRTAPDTAMPGHAGGEGSGIIDIKALAALASSPPPNPGASAAKESGVLAIGNLAHQAGTFAAIDSLSPPPHPSNTKGIAIAIVAGAAMVSAAVFGALILTRSGQPVTAPAAAAPVPAPAAPAPPAPAPTPVAVAPPPPPPPALAAPTPVPDPAATTTPAAPVPPAPAPAAGPAPAAPAAGTAAVPKETVTRAPASKPSGTSTAPAPVAPKPASAPSSAEAAIAAATGEAPATPNPYAAAPAPAAEPAPKPAEPAKPRTMDDLLDQAVTGEPAAKPDPVFDPSGLPASPTRDEVKRVMVGIEPEVRKCAQGGAIKGTAIVDLGVRGETGVVTRVRVTGLQGPVGSCIALAVRQAKFQPFSKETFNITYPYKFE